MNRRPGAERWRWALTSLTLCTTSNSRARPEMPQAFRLGVTARQMVFSVRLYKIGSEGIKAALQALGGCVKALKIDGQIRPISHCPAPPLG